MPDTIESIAQACESLKSGDLIRFDYCEGGVSSRDTVEIIATYETCNLQGKNLSVETIYVSLHHGRLMYNMQTKLHRIHLAEFSEVRNLVKLVPRIPFQE